jgi:hypothetical protein
MAPLGWAYQAAEDLRPAGPIGPAGRVVTAEARGPRAEPAALSPAVVDGSDAAALLERERARRAAAEQDAREVRVLLAAAVEAAQTMGRHLQAERSTHQAAENDLGALREELGRERVVREMAERAAKDALARKPKAVPIKIGTYCW